MPRRVMGRGSVSEVAAFFHRSSSLTSDILMTILPSYLIDAPTLLCIFPLYLLMWCI